MLPTQWRQVVADHPVVLFTRQGCHLCDQAAAELDAWGLGWHPVDIDDHPDLQAALGTDIPVIAAGGQIVARWRLDRDAVRAALPGHNLL